MLKVISTTVTSDFSVLKNFCRKTHSWKSLTELAVKQLSGFSMPKKYGF